MLGMINQLGSYVPYLLTAIWLGTELVENDKKWCLVQPQITALNQVKKRLLTEPPLVYCNLTKPAIILSNASHVGIGDVLF